MHAGCRRVPLTGHSRGTVGASLTQDTYLTEAKAEFYRRWGRGALCFRPTADGNRRAGAPLLDEDDASNGKKSGLVVWNGKYNRAHDAKPCISFNLGRNTHPQSALHPDGTCKFAHCCDHFVSDKGPGGICRALDHSRLKCTNANKCDSKQQ